MGVAFASSLWIASAFRILAGIGGGMIPPTCVAVIGDFFPGERRASSIATIAMQPGLSSIVGVPLAALLADAAGQFEAVLIDYVDRDCEAGARR